MPGVAQRMGRAIALLFHDRGTRRGWVVSSTPRPQFTPGKDPVPILQETGWAPGPVWTVGKSRPHRDLIPYRPACSQSLYRLSYLAHSWLVLLCIPYQVWPWMRNKMGGLGTVRMWSLQLLHFSHLATFLSSAVYHVNWPELAEKLAYPRHHTLF